MTRYRSLFLLLFITSLALGQRTASDGVEQPLPRITGWADNEHYILSTAGRGQSPEGEKKVHIETGAQYPYTAPIRAGIPEITLKPTDKNPQLSPDGRWVAFTRNNDLYALELSTGKEVRYTRDGSNLILNGYASWVYYEEILGRNSRYRAFWWSPDSRYLAFFRSDDSQVPMFPIYNSSGQHGFLEETRYPKAGDPNPAVSIGLVAVEGGEVVWGDFNADDDQYFGQPFWRPDGSGLLVQWMPREQDHLMLYELNPQTGRKQLLYHEYQKTWIDWISEIHWVNDGFLMVRDFDGWEQIYYHHKNGTLKARLTEGKNWKTRILRIDEQEQLVYYTANAELSTRSDLYCVRMTGKGQKRLTFGDYTHQQVLLSPDGRHFITTYSNTTTPPRIALVNTRKGSIKQLADSRGPKFAQASLNFPEMVWLTTPDGFRLPGKVTWPAKMEEGKKYPVIIDIYGGPNAATVFDGFPGFRSLSTAEQDNIIRIAIEHRGSGHCGKAGLNYLHRNLGKWEMEDYFLWVRWLREKPFVDAEKIMITGGSYGGYLTIMALTYGAEYFQYGLSQFPVTDWKLYDSHYTERYMDHPKDNPEGYRFGSVITHTDNYQAHGPAMLRVEHGTMDDNVHMQNTIQLIDQLQNKNKSFELMLFPGERHGWWGAKSRFTAAEHKRFIERYLLEK